MRALWSDRPNCFHNMSLKVKRIRRFSENFVILREFSVGGHMGWPPGITVPQAYLAPKRMP